MTVYVFAAEAAFWTWPARHLAPNQMAGVFVGRLSDCVCVFVFLGQDTRRLCVSRAPRPEKSSHMDRFIQLEGKRRLEELLNFLSTTSSRPMMNSSNRPTAWRRS